MIELKNVTYRYRSGIEALNGINASVPAGIHLLLGENGAGKTTLLHIIAGLLFPNEGSCEIDGIGMAERTPQGLSKVFLLADNVDFPQVSVNQFAAVHSPFYSGFSPELFAENLAEFGLTGNEKFRSLSYGNKRKSIIAYALALGTEVLLLDEPANGLDIGAKQILRRMVAKCAGEDRIIIISTHTVNDLEYLFDGVMMLKRGKLILSTPVENVQSSLSFIAAPVPPVGTIFYVQNAGMFHCVMPAQDANESNIDFVLLYLALQSKEAENILQLLNPTES